MNLQVQRAEDRYLGVPLCALLSVANRLRPAVPRDGPPRRILVILLSEMGSLVLARPMFARLMADYPDASLHVLVFSGNREEMERSSKSLTGEALKRWRGAMPSGT